MDEKFKKSALMKVLSGGSFSIEDFVATMQGFSLDLRKTHWETKSYALHKAVEATQETLDGLLDDFVEAYVGCEGGTRPKFKESISCVDDPDSVIATLKSVGVKDSSLLNIRDEMLHAVYKLKYLKTLS
jgi:DNA-binding ferritin-like protein